MGADHDVPLLDVILTGNDWEDFIELDTETGEYRMGVWSHAALRRQNRLVMMGVFPALFGDVSWTVQVIKLYKTPSSPPLNPIRINIIYN